MRCPGNEDQQTLIVMTTRHTHHQADVRGQQVVMLKTLITIMIEHIIERLMVKLLLATMLKDTTIIKVIDILQMNIMEELL